MNLNLPVIRTPQEYAFETLQEQVKAVEATLVPGEDVLGMFASFGTAMNISISAIRLEGQFFVFVGCDDQGRDVHLVQPLHAAEPALRV